MGAYILRRILQAIPLIIIVTAITFIMIKLAGDPLAYLAQDPRIREEDRFRRRELLGLNDTIPQQFVTWLIGDTWRMRDLDNDGEGDVFGEQRGILRGDFGESIHYRVPATELIAERLPNTLILGGTAFVVTLLTSLVIGIYAALNQYSLVDNLVTGISFVLFSMPIFLIALLMVYFFAVKLRQANIEVFGLPIYLPVQGMESRRGAPGAGTFRDLVWHMILPVFCLSAISIAGYSRYIRASMLDTLNSDYIRTARAKGLSNRRVTFLHALKNAALPIITLIGLDIPFILSGAVVTERIFSWRGTGLLFIESIERLDAPVITIFTLMIVVAVVFFQLITDIAYAALDPRVRYS
jgi:peptide/nickel transport system permease protein